MAGEDAKNVAYCEISSRANSQSLAGWIDTILAFQGALRSFFARRAAGQDVDDLVSEVTVNLLQRRSVRPVVNERSYIFSSAANTLKRRRTQPCPLPDMPDMPDEAVDWLSPERHLIAKEMLQQAELAIASLSPRCRAVFVLSRYNHMTYGQIAEHLGISVKMVEKHMSKALARIANAIEQAR